MMDIPSEMAHAHLEPGETCPTCERRVPHPKKESSPKSKAFAFRVPEDLSEPFTVLEEEAVAHVKLKGAKFQRYNLYNVALYHLLQDPDPLGTVNEFLRERDAA